MHRLPGRRRGRRAALAALTAVAASVGTTAVAGAAPAQPFFTALPASGTSQLAQARTYATATTLPNGKVLVTGGYDGNFMSTTEVFDPAGPSFATVPVSMLRAYGVAAPLPGGKILFAGGYPTYQQQTASIFDASDSSVTDLPASAPTQPTAARAGAVAAPLPDGKVLIAGGTPLFPPDGAVRTAEIFNPADNSFTALPASGNTQLTVARRGAVAAPLPDGKVLIAGGTQSGDDGTLLRSAEIFDPADNSFTALPASGSTQLGTGRITAVAAALPDGQVLIAGGWDGASTALATAELFDPETNTFSQLPASGTTKLATGRRSMSAAVLQDGRVLIAGGGSAGSGSFLQSAELFTPAPAARGTGGAFGEQVVGTAPVERTVTVTNRGAQALTIDPGTPSIAGGAGGDFSLVGETCAGQTLAYQATCTLTVRFSPSAIGTRSAHVDLPSNEPDSTSSVSLTGIGAPIPPAAAPPPPETTGSGTPAPAAATTTPTGKAAPKATCTAKRSAKTKRTRITCTITGLPAKRAAASLSRRKGAKVAAGRMTAAGRLTLTTKARVTPGTYRLTIGGVRLTVRIR